MKQLMRVAVAVTIAAGVPALLAGPASGHDLSASALTCTEVSGTFHDFTAGEHPIVWHVQVAGGAYQSVATTESPAAFVGSGSATADITTLTSVLNGTTATVRAYAAWPGGQSATQSVDLTCGLPVQVEAAHSEAPAAAAVQAAATFTG